MKTQVAAKITIQGVSKEFNLTIDWNKLSEDEMRALAQRSIVIAWQNEHRTANKGQGEWPKENPTIDAKDYSIGRTRAPADPVKMIEGKELTQEELARLQKVLEMALKDKKG